MSDIEREEFEQAVADKWSDSYKFTRFGDEDYYDEVLEGMWWGWQASRQALEGEPVAYITERKLEWLKSGPVLSAVVYRKHSEGSIPLYTHPASRQALEGEPTAIVNDSGVLEWYPPYNRPPAGTKLYTHPASADVPEGWTFTRESDGRIVINADGLGFYVARLEADRIAEILLYALANDLLNDGTSKADEVSDFNAEIRTVRDICDEYQNYLVFVSRGKSEPYLHVPDDVNEDVLAEAIKRLNATPTKAKSVAEDSDYIDALQGTFDIIQADANTERNYEALCRVGATLKELKAKQEQDK